MAIYNVVKEPVASIVAALEDALAEARSGKTEGLAICSLQYGEDGRCRASTLATGSPDMLTDPLVGALARLQYRLMSGT